MKRFRAAALTGLVLAGMLVIGPEAAGKTFVVDILTDPVPDGCTPGACSLREAIIAANKTKKPDKIQMGATVPSFGETFVLTQTGDGDTGGDLDITSKITFTDVNFERIEGGPGWNDRLVDIARKGNVRIGFIEFLGGNSLAPGAQEGGSIRNFGKLIVGGATFITSHSGGNGGAIANFGTLTAPIGFGAVGPITSNGDGGFIWNKGKLSISQGDLDVGAALGSGGALFNSGGGRVTLTGRPVFSRTFDSGIISGTTAGADGAGIANAGSITINGWQFKDLASTGSGAGLFNTGTARIINSTFSANAANGPGGAVFSNGSLTISNSTFSGNGSSTNGGAIHVANGSATLSHVTIANNLGTGPDGIATGPGVVVPMRASIVSGDTCSPGVSSGGFNVSHPAPCGSQLSSDQVADPQLGALALNGGPNPTHAIPVGSPAQAQEPKKSKKCKGADQRGAPRPAGGDTGCDAGAYELNVCQGAAVNIVGTKRAETIWVEAGNVIQDVVLALGGNDDIKVLGGEDHVCAGEGRDTIDGGAGAFDVLNGGPDKDRCIDADLDTVRVECERTS